jgi:hypothetical protein
MQHQLQALQHQLQVSQQLLQASPSPSTIAALQRDKAALQQQLRGLEEQGLLLQQQLQQQLQVAPSCDSVAAAEQGTAALQQQLQHETECRVKSKVLLRDLQQELLQAKRELESERKVRSEESERRVKSEALLRDLQQELLQAKRELECERERGGGIGEEKGSVATQEEGVGGDADGVSKAGAVVHDLSASSPRTAADKLNLYTKRLTKPPGGLVRDLSASSQKRSTSSPQRPPKTSTEALLQQMEEELAVRRPPPCPPPLSIALVYIYGRRTWGGTPGRASLVSLYIERLTTPYADVCHFSMLTYADVC